MPSLGSSLRRVASRSGPRGGAPAAPAPADGAEEVVRATGEQYNADEVYEKLKQALPEFLAPPAEFDSAEWELQDLGKEIARIGGDTLKGEQLAEVSRRHQERKQQGEVVFELLNRNVRDNYASFVDGMNKIQEVGACSQQTTKICDDGKDSLKRAKEEMVRKALEVTQAARQKHNMLRVTAYTRQLQALYAQDSEIRRLVERGQHAQAALAVVRGLRMTTTQSHPHEVQVLRDPGGSLGMTLDECRVVRVLPGGPADAAGIAADMQICEIGTTPVDSRRAISSALQSCGREVRVVLNVPDLRLGELQAVRGLTAAWEQAKAKCVFTLEGTLQELCRQFDPTRFRMTLEAFGALGQLQGSGERLRQAWLTTVKRLAIFSVRPFVVKHTQNQAEQDRVERLPYADMVRKIRPEDSVLGQLSLLSDLAGCMWTYRAMLRWLSQRDAGKQWLQQLRDFRDTFWNQVQQHIQLYLQGQPLGDMHLLQVRDLFSHLNVFMYMGRAFHERGFTEVFTHTADELLRNYLQRVHHSSVIGRFRHTVREELWGPLDQRQAHELTAHQGAAQGADRDQRRGEAAARFLDAAEVDENPFREAKVSGGFDWLDAACEAAQGKQSPPPQHSPPHSPRDEEPPILTQTSLTLCREIQQYADIAELFPHLAHSAFTLSRDLVCLYAYAVYANFCHTAKDLKEPYLPEQDSELPTQILSALSSVADVARSALPREQGPGGEQGAPAPPAVHQRVRDKLMDREQHFGLPERVVATESVRPLLRLFESKLARLTELMRDPRTAQEAQRTAERYSFLATHQAKVMAKRLSLLMLPLDGYPKAISEGKWEPKAAETEPSAYVSSILKEAKRFGDDLRKVTVMLPCGASFSARIWRYVVDNIWFILVEGYSKVKRCNDQGRSLMTMDLSSLHHGLKMLAQGVELPSTEVVDDYVKGFWKLDERGGEAYIDWIRNSHTRYTQRQLLALLHINSGLLGRKSEGKKELARKAEEELARLEHRDRAVLDVL
eukprot:TRINITY_DN3523_c0_g1_i1.p1 TRINITY_DN3523_c0_g1~~TRINITY_DN3523_c0_g1_i1.p1  ORF type:complete len:1032 (+),score=354.56 TRINITY_DN3523_c0_g1_i1:79-3096(+)